MYVEWLFFFLMKICKKKPQNKKTNKYLNFENKRRYKKQTLYKIKKKT